MKNSSWETKHIQSECLMVHTFTNGIIVNVFWRKFTIEVTKDGNVLRTFDTLDMSVDEYIRMLIGISNE